MALASADWSLIPTHMCDSVRGWIEDGKLPGSFLTAVLSNSLVGAIQLADDINRERLHDIVQFLYWHAPNECWGSPGKVSAWHESGGFNGQVRAEKERIDRLHAAELAASKADATQ